MAVSPSPYEVLGVGQDATQADIRKAYQEALRSRTHSRPQVTQAFNQLRNPQNRLAADLLEPPPDPEVDGAPAPARRSFVDGESAPLPVWTALIATDAVVTREVDDPPDAFRSPDGGPPSSALVPPVEFPV
jgi:hypothetical protein